MRGECAEPRYTATTEGVATYGIASPGGAGGWGAMDPPPKATPAKQLE